MSQADQIAGHLRKGKTVTSVEALEQWGCFRLAARISDLRAQGMNILTETIERNGKKFARYRMG